MKNIILIVKDVIFELSLPIKFILYTVGLLIIAVAYSISIEINTILEIIQIVF